MSIRRIGSLFLALVLAMFVTMSVALPMALAAGDSWETKADMPTARYVLGVVEANGKIYAIGGNDGSNYVRTVEEYDPTTDTWTTKEDMPSFRYSFGVAAANGKIYVFGGKNASSGDLLDTVEEYDPTTDTWTTKRGMSQRRCGFGAAEVNGKIYITSGGSWYGTDDYPSLEEYDPVTDTWTKKGEFSKTCVATANGKIYGIGGPSSSNQYILAEYDPATNTSTHKADILTGRLSAGITEANGKIYAIGGRNYDSVNLDTVEEYDPITDAWTTKASMPTSRKYLGVAEANGIIYAIGGLGGDGNEVEAYTPSSTTPDAPINLTATAGDEQVSLSWDSDSVSGDVYGYNVKRSTTSGGSYDVIAEVTETSYVDKDVSNGTTYYYVVTAYNDEGESQNSNEASATPQSSGGGGYDGDYNLVIYLVSGLVREYEVSGDELEDFIDWCEDNETGTGLTMYEFENDSDLGAYDSRTDYIVFDKIMMFEVNEY